MLSRVVGGVASGNLFRSHSVYSRCDIALNPVRREWRLSELPLAWALSSDLALGGWASTMDPLGSDARGVFVLNEFSLAAVISLAPGVLNWVWLASCFKETLPPEKRATVNAPKPAIFQIGKVSNPAVRKTCLSYLFYMISFSGMEFTLTFLAVERFNYTPADIAKMFLLIGFTLIVAQGFFVRRFVGPVGEKKLALIGIFIGVVAFALISSFMGSLGFIFRFSLCLQEWPS